MGTESQQRILVAGWRGIPHSYAVVNQFQCLELLKRLEVRLYFEDLPYYNPTWQPMRGLFSRADEDAIAQIPSLPAGLIPDAELRIVFPYDLLRPPRAKRTFVFGTAEYRAVPPTYIAERQLLESAHRMHNSSIVIITPSHWSRDGFIRSGADPRRVVVVPHGVDPGLFHPPTSEQRAAARVKHQMGDDEFVFLNIGAMTGNKNTHTLLRGFVAILYRNPRAKLMLKGTDALYPSQKMFMTAAMQALSHDDMRAALPRVVYTGKSLSFEEMAILYHAADCYISPYIAEGFNLPVLEAAACGLPVICTGGGPTDGFTTDAFAWRIKSNEIQTEHQDGITTTELLPDAQHLEHLMDAIITDYAFRKQASKKGPLHVSANFTWKRVIDDLLAIMKP